MFPQQFVHLFIMLGSWNIVAHPSEIALILVYYNCLLTCGVHGGTAGQDQASNSSKVRWHLETEKITLFPSLSLGAVKGAHNLRQICLL